MNPLPPTFPPRNSILNSVPSPPKTPAELPSTPFRGGNSCINMGNGMGMGDGIFVRKHAWRVWSPLPFASLRMRAERKRGGGEKILCIIAGGNRVTWKKTGFYSIFENAIFFIIHSRCVIEESCPHPVKKKKKNSMVKKYFPSISQGLEAGFKTTLTPFWFHLFCERKGETDHHRNI